MAAVVDPAPRDRIVDTDWWQVGHAFDTSLPGWLVVAPKTHITSYAELAPAAAAEIGSLLHRLSQALRTVTGCAKTYQMQFSEAEGFSHLHIHLVPRMADQPVEARGPRVFAYLGRSEAERVPAEERDRISLAVREALA